MSIHSFLPKAYLRGEYVNFAEANVSIATHALHYGTAAFGGLRIYPDPTDTSKILVFRLEDHIKRLLESARILFYDISFESIEKAIIEFIKVNKPTKPSYIRPLVYIDEQTISLKIDTHSKDLLIYGIELGDYISGEGVKMCFSSWIRQSSASIPLAAKISGAYITSCLAKTEAVSRGFDDAIFLNSNYKVAEGTGMNIFIVKNGVVSTSSADQDILEGLTSKSVQQIIKDRGYELQKRVIDKSELISADEVFMTGTAAKISSVRQIENYILPIENPVTRNLQSIFEEIVLGKSKNTNYNKWITRVDV